MLTVHFPVEFCNFIFCFDVSAKDKILIIITCVKKKNPRYYERNQALDIASQLDITNKVSELCSDRILNKHHKLDEI